MKVTSEQICQDLLDIIGLIKASLAGLSEKYDLTIMQVHALYAISQGDTTMGKVAFTLHCDASNVTGIVDRLVAAALITRQEGPLDRRTKTLHLTEKGQNAVDEIYSKLPNVLGCGRLTEQERSAFHDVVTKLSTSELLN